MSVNGPLESSNCSHNKSWIFDSIGLLTHWGRVTHICVVKLTIIGSDNGLLPGQHQAIIWTNAAILLIGPSRTNFIENLIGIQTFSFKKMHLKMSSVKWWPFCLDLNVLMGCNRSFEGQCLCGLDLVIADVYIKLSIALWKTSLSIM